MAMILLTLSVLFSVVGMCAAALSTDPRRWWLHWCLVAWLAWMALPKREKQTEPIAVQRPYYEAMLNVMAHVERMEQERLNAERR